MINLLKLELFKEFKNKRFYVILLLIIFVSISSIVILSNKKDFTNEKLLIVEEKLDEKTFYELYPFSDYKNYLNQYDVYVKEMSNQIKINNGKSEEFKFGDVIISIQVFIGIAVAILGGSIISSEYSNGTIKHLLVSNSRKKVLLSKFLALMIFILIFNLVLLCTSTLTSLIVTESNIFDLTQLVVRNNLVVKTNAYLVFLSKYFFYMLPLIFIGTFSFFLSTISNSNSLSISISIIVVLIGSFLSQVCFGFNINFVQYTFLPYVDYTIFLDKLLLINNNIELGINLNIKSATIILILYALVFYGISQIVFNKKDFKC